MPLPLALTIFEIRSEILQHLKPIRPTSRHHSKDNAEAQKARQNLLSVTLSCRALKDPALDILWAAMPAIVPLLKLLPGAREHDGKVRIYDEIKTNDLKVFYSYAYRVVHYTAHDFWAIESNTHSQLLRLKDGLLPSLVSIEFPSPDVLVARQSLISSLLPVFLHSKSVSSVVVATRYSDTNHHKLSGFVSSLMSIVNYKAIRNLQLPGTLSPEDITSLSRFRGLRSVSFRLSSCAYASDILDVLSYHPLHELLLDFGSSSPIPHEMARNDFPDITLLSLTGQSPMILCLLDAITADNLESISIKETEFCYTDRTAAIHGHIYGGFRRFVSLRRISFRVVELDWENEEHESNFAHVNPVSIIRHFLGLIRLETLSLHVLAPWFGISDDDISKLAVACPALKVLSLAAIIAPLTPVYIVRPTYLSMLCIATTCYNLLELDISVDFLNMDETSLPDISSHRLRKLDLRDTSIDHSKALPIARVLRRLFPHLNNIRGRHTHRIHGLITETFPPISRNQGECRAMLPIGTVDVGRPANQRWMPMQHESKAPVKTDARGTA